MAEREMRTVMESVQTMLLHMGVQHHWRHLALRQAVRVRNCLERSTLQLGMTPNQLLTRKKPNLSLARVWGCMAQFLVPEQQRGGKLKPKARWGLHLGVSEESKGWELLDIADNWDVPFPSPSLAPRAPPLVADLRGLTPVSASGNEGRSWASLVAPAKNTASGRRDVQQVDVRVKSTLAGEEQAEEVQPMVDAEGSNAGGNEAKQAEVEESTNSNESTEDFSRTNDTRLKMEQRQPPEELKADEPK
ncbi:unnamed protein product [Closterium sp. NIES-53]